MTSAHRAPKPAPAPPALDSRLAVNVRDAAVLASVSETRIWAEIAANRLRSFKVGRRRLIRVAALTEWLERRELLDMAASKVPGARRAG